ncbi:MAG: invasion associated locus B family protein [Magnetospiraceae bacterium]
MAHVLKVATVALTIVFVWPQLATAQALESRDKHGYWWVFQNKDTDSTLCYMASEPTRKQGNYTKRGDVYAMITHRPNDKTYHVVSITTGYTYDTTKPVEVAIDGDKKFNLFPHGEDAWANDEKDDKALVVAMRRGGSMVVQGTSSRGTLTTDTYSLSGFTAAHKAINAACKAKW